MFSHQRLGSIFTKLLLFSFVVIGTYNAFVINVDSEISTADMKFVKRLDEMYGIETPGRMVAASTSWKKISRKELKKNPIIQTVQRIDSSLKDESRESVISSAAIQEELNMVLAEVINPKRWQTALPKAEFSGALSTRDGLIENLSISLPGVESISVSFVEMAGNVFEYDYEGEIYSGMIYQVDKSSYMVTLTNGPLEGTRLKFLNQGDEVSPLDEQEHPEFNGSIKEDATIVAGDFGAEVDPNFEPDEISRYDQEIQRQAQEAQSFKF